MTRRPRPITAADGAERDPVGRVIRTLLRAGRPIAPTASAGSQRMHTTMSFLTTTSVTASELPTQPPPPRLEVVGYDRAAGRIVLREHAGGAVTTAVLATTGAGAGAIIPLGRARIPSRALIALEPAPLAGWELITRVIQRRGLRVFGDLAPIRKFALSLTVQQQLGGVAGARGRVVTTAYLRPRAALTSVWLVPGEPLAVALVSYCGVPTGVGVDKQAAVLAMPSWH